MPEKLQIFSITSQTYRNAFTSLRAVLLMSLTFAALTGIVAAVTLWIGTPEALSMLALAVVALGFVSPAAAAFVSCVGAIGGRTNFLPSALLASGEFWRFSLSALGVWWIVFVPSAALFAGGAAALSAGRSVVGLTAFMVLVALAMAWILFANARIASACAAVVAGGRFGVASAWRRTRGNSVRVAVVFLLTCSLPLVAASKLLGMITPSSESGAGAMPSLLLVTAYLVVKICAYALWGSFCGTTLKALQADVDVDAHEASAASEGNRTLASAA